MYPWALSVCPLGSKKECKVIQIRLVFCKVINPVFSTRDLRNGSKREELHLSEKDKSKEN